MVEFVDASLEDLVNTTEFLHQVRPDFRGKVVVGIEKAQPLDQSIVFHLMSEKDEREIFILSAEYITEHPYLDS